MSFLGTAYTVLTIGKAAWKHKKTIFVVIAALFFLLYFVICLLLLPVVSLGESLKESFEESGLSQEEYRSIMEDAGALAAYMEDNEDFTFFEEDAFLLDKRTVLRILKAVAEYNSQVSDYHEVEYEYLIETGPLSEADPVTGNTSVITQEAGQSLEQADSGNSQAPAGSTSSSPAAASTVQKYETARVSLRRMDIDNDNKISGENVFYLQWQPILALCSMYILDNVQSWGSYDDGMEEAGTAEYYLSDEEIDDIIHIFAYEYDYYDDCSEENTAYRSFEDCIRPVSGYRLRIVTTGTGSGKERVIQRIPAIAPKSMKNSYLTYEYNYQNLENGFLKLTERTYTLIPERFLAACESLISSFEPDLFIMTLEQLPCAEEETAYYRDVIIPMAEKKEIYTVTTDNPQVCPSIGVYVSTGTSSGAGGSLGDSGFIEWEGESFTLPLYGINGWNGIYVKPGEWIVEEGKSYGSFQVYEDATKSLTVSDALTLEQLTDFFQNYGFSEKIRTKSPLFASQQALEDTAQCFYDYQEKTGTSVCGLIGIMLQEGGFASAITTNGWNYFNIKAADGQPTTSYTTAGGEVRHTSFRNYKEDFENAAYGLYETPAVNALASQMNWINERYWSRGQNSYYLMVWNGYNAEDPEHAYEGISHSYCPPWDDQAMPYAQDSYRIGAGGEKLSYWKNANSSYHGWINNCASFRYKVYHYIAGS